MQVVKFEQRYVKSGDTTVPVDYVLLAPKGENFDKVQTWLKVKEIIPPADPDPSVANSETYKAMKGRWEHVGPRYEAWKSNNQVPEFGTPLAAWAGVSPEQVEALKHMAIRTVEDVRDMTEGAIKRLPFPNARQLPKLAREYLEGRDAADKDAKMADMAERMAIMEQMLSERVEEKRGPGRPKKVEEPAE